MARAAIMMRKWKGRLVPADAYAQQQTDELPEGKELSVRVSVMSSTGKTQREGMRGLWFGGLELLAQNTDDMSYDSKDKAYHQIRVDLGYTRKRFRIDGTYEEIPISTSEESMPDEEFQVLMERAQAFVEATMGWNPWQVWKQEKDAEAANRRYR